MVLQNSTNLSFHVQRVIIYAFELFKWCCACSFYKQHSTKHFVTNTMTNGIHMITVFSIKNQILRFFLSHFPYPSLPHSTIFSLTTFFLLTMSLSLPPPHYSFKHSLLSSIISSIIPSDLPFIIIISLLCHINVVHNIMSWFNFWQIISRIIHQITWLYVVLSPHSDHPRVTESIPFQSVPSY